MEDCGYLTADFVPFQFVHTDDSVVNRVVECCVVDNI
jgi:hypothetical protein